jgi:hypothetical protein
MTETVQGKLTITISPSVVPVSGAGGATLTMPQTVAVGGPDRATVAMQLSKIEEIVEYLKALYR